MTPTPSLLDEAEARVAAVGASGLAALFAGALPLRLLQAHFLLELFTLGRSATAFGHHLALLSALLLLAVLPWLWGRGTFVERCREVDTGDRGFAGRDLPPQAPLDGSAVDRRRRMPATRLLALLYLTLLCQVGLLLLLWTVVLAPLPILLAGVAAACHPYLDRAGLRPPLATLFGSLHGTRHLVGAMVVLALGWLVAWANLMAFGVFALWCASSLGGFDVGRWQVLLSPRNPGFLVWTAAGATLLLEPFWLATCSAFVERARSRSSGADLVLRVNRLFPLRGSR